MILNWKKIADTFSTTPYILNWNKINTALESALGILNWHKINSHEPGGGGSTVDDFNLSEVYTFGNNGSKDITWICADKVTDYIILQSRGVTGGTWPGYKMTGSSDGSASWGSANTVYDGSINGKDIHTYDTKMSNLYDSIKDAEKTGITGKSGLYLSNSANCGVTSYSSVNATVKRYRDGMKYAATNASSFGISAANPASAWSGYWSNANTGKASAIKTNGDSTPISQSLVEMLAPEFLLDPSNVTIDSNNVLSLVQ